MAIFTLTPGIDNFSGLAGENNFFDFTSADLQSTDTITGGATGSFIDTLRITAAGTIVASQFAGVTNVEQLLLSSAGNSVTLTNGLIAGTSIGYFAVVDGPGDDTVDASAVSNNIAVAFFASIGADTFKGGNGNDAFAFNPTELTSADTVQGGAGVDNLYLNAAGTLAAGAFTNVTGIEGLVLANGTNNVTLTNGLIAGTSIGYFAVAGGTGNDTVDASAVSNSIPVAFFSNGGSDTFQGGNGNDAVVIATADLPAATLTGGAGIDNLYLTNAGTVAAAGFANVTGFEGLVLANGTNNIALSNGFVAGTSIGYVAVAGGTGNDTVDASAVTNNTPIAFYGTTGGNDTFTGGNGNDSFLFGAAGTLTSADTVVGGAGNDTLWMTANITVNTGDLAEVSGIEGVFQQSGGTFNFANGLTGTGNLAAVGSSAVDTFNGTAVTGYALTFTGNGGADVLTGGSQDDIFNLPDSAFASINGNGGLDRIVLTTVAQSFNLTANNAKITNTEIISLSSSAAASLTLAGTDIPLVNAGTNLLHVVGEANDSVTAGTGWTVLNANVVNNAVAAGHTFTEYVHTNNAHLFIDTAITPSITAKPSVPVDTDTDPNSVAELAANGTAVELTASSFGGTGTTVTYSLTDNAGGRFAIDSSTGVVTVANGSLIDYETAPSHAYSITVQATSNGQTNTASFSIGVTDVNEAPNTNAVTATGNEDPTGPAYIPITLTGSDVDAGDSIASYHVITLPSGTATGTLFTDTGLTTPVVAGNTYAATAGTLTLYFSPAANSNGSVTFSAAAIDSHGLEDATPATETITVTAVNDGPVNTIPTDASIGTAFSNTDFTVSGISIADVDAGAALIHTTLSVTNGILTVALGGSGATISGGANGSATVTLQGTVAQINAALANNVIFHSTDGFTGQADLTVATNDGGNTGTGGTLTDTDVIHIGVIPQVFIIDNTPPGAGNNGSLTDPFNSINSFNTSANDGSGDYIYIRSGTYSEADGINLLSNEHLFGEGQTLSFTNPVTNAVVTIGTGSAGLTPTISVTGANQHGIDLGANDEVTGLNVATTLGNQIGIHDSGASVGTLKMSDIDVTGVGEAVNITHGGALTVAIDTLTSTGSTTNGIHLGATGTALTGSFSAGTGANAAGSSISGSTGNAFVIGDGAGGANSGGAATISFGGAITATGTARAVDIQDRVAGAGNIDVSGTITHSSGNANVIFLDQNAAGTITFSGASSVLNGGTSDAVHLTSNTGATISFTGGGLNIDTTSGTGFLVTGGGTVNVTGSNNSLTSTNATALNVANTAIGASGLTFHDISSGNNDAGADPANGIILNTTGTSGGLTVTGTGSTAGSGGTIQHATGSGILITSTKGLSLANMMINNNGDAIDEGGLRANELTGTASITNTTITGSFHANARIADTSGTLNLTVSNSTFTSSTTHDGFDVIVDGTANVTANISNSTFSNNFSDGFDGGAFSNTGTSTSAISITSSHFVNNGANGILISEAGSSNTWFNIHDNTDITGNPSLGINLFMNNQTTSSGLLRGLVNNNTINYNTVNGGGQGLLLNTQGSGTATVEITNNTVNYTDGANTGITIQSGDGTPNTAQGGSGPTGHTVVKFTGNTVNMVDNPANGNAFALRAINIESGLTAASNRTINLDLGTAASTTDNNHVTFDATSMSNGVEGLRVRERPNSDFTIVGLSPSPSTTAAQVQSFISSVTGLSTSDIFVSGPSSTFEINYTNGTADTTPAQSPLLSATGGVASTSSTPGETHLSRAQLDGIVAAAISHWAAAGASADQLAVLHTVTYDVADLTPGWLGASTSGHVTIDVDADGHGWFIDPTPDDNTEFPNAAGSGGTDLLTEPALAAAGHPDLLTAVMHELGHVLGLPDSTASADIHDLMYINLVDGERRLPDASDVVRSQVTDTAAIAQAAEAALPASAAAPEGTLILPGTAGDDMLYAGPGGIILAGGAGADTFVFGQVPQPTASAPAAAAHIADYSALQGDTIDFSALQILDAAKVRAVEDASDAFATLQIDIGGASYGDTPGGRGAPAAGPHWVDIAQLDGVHAGDPVNVITDAARHTAQIHADWMI